MNMNRCVREKDKEDAILIAQHLAHRSAPRSDRISKKALKLAQRLGSKASGNLVLSYVKEFKDAGPCFLENGVHIKDQKIIVSQYNDWRKETVNPKLYRYTDTNLDPKVYILAVLNDSDKRKIAREGVFVDKEPVLLQQRYAEQEEDGDDDDDDVDLYDNEEDEELPIQRSKRLVQEVDNNDEEEDVPPIRRSKRLAQSSNNNVQEPKRARFVDYQEVDDQESYSQESYESLLDDSFVVPDDAPL
jgi:hypothetical protein